MMAQDRLKPGLIITGSHLDAASDGLLGQADSVLCPVLSSVEMTPVSDDAKGVCEAMGRGMQAFAHVYSAMRADIDLLFTLGDRFEMFSAAAASIPFNIPVAHLHGGETSLGSVDETYRHCISRISQFHFPATPQAASKLQSLGVDPAQITVSGAPALDAMATYSPCSQAEIEQRVQMKLDQPPLLVTFHPATREPGCSPVQQTEILLEVLAAWLDRYPLIITHPNADAGGRGMASALRAFCSAHPGRAAFVTTLGPQMYYSVMSRSAAMIGNSSSGIIEAAHFKLPVVDIGMRQNGRLCGSNVIHVPCDADDLNEAIIRALSPAFRQSLAQLVNPYGDGHAAERIVERLLSLV